MLHASKFSLLAKCVRQFGVVDGVKLGARLATGRGEFAVRIPAYREPVLVRAGTSDATVFVQIFADREYESEVEEAQIIFDLGANVGYASIFFAQRFPNSQIIAVEPDESNFVQLQKNIQGYANITALKRAVWPTHEQIQIGNPDAEKWLFQVEGVKGKSENQRVEAVTMCDLVEMIGFRPIDILKVDIESAEKELFQTNAHCWLSNTRLIMIELHDFLKEGCSHSFFSAITRHRYNHWIRGENHFVELIHEWP